MLDIAKFKTLALPDTESGKQFTIVLPWDSTVQSVMLAFVRARCHHIDGRVNYIVMGGPGCRRS
jgi:hypothetical protein